MAKRAHRNPARIVKDLKREQYERHMAEQRARAAADASMPEGKGPPADKAPEEVV